MVQPQIRSTLFLLALALVSLPAGIAAQAAPRETYLVEFKDEGLIQYRGGIAGLRAVSPLVTGRPLDPSDPAVQAFLAFAEQRLAGRIAEVAQAIGREPEVLGRYTVTQIGAAVRVSAEEAAAIARLPSVRHVMREPIEQPQTYNSPQFIGAHTIWNGSSVPGGTPNRGQGVRIGIADSGLHTLTHPSFSDMGAECGYATPLPKVLARWDCVSGTCSPVTTDPVANANYDHGVHVAGTAGGRSVPADTGTPPPSYSISGVAPCAQLVTYRVCDSGCPGSAILAAIQRMPLDGVQVANFSLGPVGPAQFSPWDPSEGSLRYLPLTQAGIFVAVAAGNTRSASQGGPENPTGNVKSTGPWITTVANITDSARAAGTATVQILGPGSVPPSLQNVSVNLTSTSGNLASSLLSTPLTHYETNVGGCTANGGFPANFFQGRIALVERGGCTFEEKANNAAAAGALAVILYNNTTGTFSPLLGSATVPVFVMLQADGQAIRSFVNAAGQPANSNLLIDGLVFGNVLSASSLTGPAQFTDGITKPDIAAPGTSIYAATWSNPGYGNLSGTSMASPHIAGAAALIRAVHPSWTPAEVKSALMLTAFNPGLKPNATTPWDADDVGSGRVDLTKAARAGLVMDIDPAIYNTPAINPLNGGNPTLLNLPSMRTRNAQVCRPACTWTRTVRNTLSTPATWNVGGQRAAGHGPPGHPDKLQLHRQSRPDRRP
ncbi:MAG: S8 family serine peptidase [Xanthomonadales bacterium]|nr:S8 family serine peptidase [Xanthomonadales bacterium]